MDAYKAACSICESPVYYYPAKLLLEPSKLPSINKATGADTRARIVSCNCTGEKGGIKHTSDYEFPKNFQKL